MKQLSVGADSNLKNWRDLASIAFGADSGATKYLNAQIAEKGENEEVLADEGQFIHFLWEMSNETNSFV